MDKLSTSDKIYVSKSVIPGAGRGVFAKGNIKLGELIERCPVIEIPEGDSSLLTETILVTYFYFLGKKKERVTLTLGFGSIYNHSYTPNAIYKDKHRQRAIDFVAIKPIKKGEEITVSYNPGKKNKNPLWFYPSSRCDNH